MLVPFLRLTRDQRGYENTFLLHVDHLGERPRILYWYRTAPGVRVGRPALDEDAIRTIEEQHPEIEFDWPHIFAIGAAMTPEIEPRPDRAAQRGSRTGDVERRRGRDDERGPSTRGIEGSLRTSPEGDSRAEEPERAGRAPARPREPDIPGPVADEAPAPSEPVSAAATDQSVGAISEPLPQAAERQDLLAELVGREIATRLRARYTELHTRLQAVPDAAKRAAWQGRVEALNPDAWATPEEILRGVQQADSLFDELRRLIKLD
jgi:hypothetical protein